MAGIILLPALLYSILRIPVVQTRTVNYISQELARELDSEISIGRVSISFFNKISLNEVYISDQNGDTLAYIHRLVAGIGPISTKKKSIHFTSVNFDGFFMNLHKNSDGVNNLKFLVRHFKKNDDSIEKESWKIFATEMELKNSRLYVSRFDTTPKPNGINYSDLRFLNMNIKATDFAFFNDSVLANFQHIEVQEQSGFSVNHIEGKFIINPVFLSLEDAHLHTGSSNIAINNLDFYYQDYDGLSDFVEHVSMEIYVSDSEVSFTDIAAFAPSLEGMNDLLHLEAYVSGKIGSLSCRYVDLKYGEKTRFSGDIQFMGLPDIDHTFIHADINSLTSNYKDIENLRLPNLSKAEYAQIPALVNELGLFNYRGFFTGFVADFVAFGELKTDAGTLISDIKLKEDLSLETMYYSGNIETRDFSLQKIFPELTWLGGINLNFHVEGKSDAGSINTRLDGLISEIIINNQSIHGISIRGNQDNERFDGFMNIDDEHVSLEFSGLVDFSQDVPYFSFSSIIDTLDLIALGLIAGDSIASFKADIQTNFKASSLDDLEGEILLWDVRYTKNNQSIEMNDFSLFADRDEENSFLRVNSSLLDIHIEGLYLFKDIPLLMTQYLTYYFPSLGLKHQRVVDEHNFQYEIKIKEPDQLLEAFLPKMKIPSGAYISGNMNSSKPSFTMNIELPQFEFSSIKLNKGVAFLHADFNDLEFNLDANNLELTQDFFLEGFEFASISKSDTSAIQLKWKNQSIKRNQGDVKALLHIENVLTSNPIFNLDILSSVLVVSDSIWNLKPSKVQIDGNSLSIESFVASQNRQSIAIDGGLYRGDIDTLVVRLAGIELSDFNSITRNYGIETSGVVEGSASLLTGNRGSLFFSDLVVDSLHLNSEYLGNLIVSSIWNDTLNRVEMFSDLKKGTMNPMRIKGSFQPKGELLDFTIDLDKFNLKAVEPFMVGIFSNVNGIVSQTLNLKGSLSNPQLLGELKVQRAAFTVDYLNTRYFFSDFIQFKPDTILLQSISLTDSEGNQAVMNGRFTHQSFKNFAMNIGIETSNLLVLNTSVFENPDYYGKALAAGVFTISGPLDNILIDINARTNAGTLFNILLDAGSDASSGSFVTFVNPNKDDLLDEKEELRMPGGLRLNFNLEVTPEAEVQLIFDSKMGDIIRGNGQANLKMEINSQGDFTMYGDFTIQKGDYLLTLANFFSRKFKIKEGGSIRWSGSPYEAEMDLIAYYEAQAQLKDLLSDSSDVYRNKLNVECQIAMTGNLLEPDFQFKIQLPASADTEQTILNGLPDNELNKQFISLLVINQFQPLLGFSLAGGSAFGSSNLSQNTTEILSNQLSHWVSQISNDFDIGFKYRPGNELSTDELEFALRTQLFNDYLTINGNLGVGGQYAYTNTMVGDVEAELKIIESGKLRLKAFNRSNTNLDYEKGPFTRGVGVFFREEFNSVGDLWKKYFSISDDE